ncbi:MAG: hypothetical protein IKN43_04345, partial [Selenomonadaceae bacterium]|nr:hypothetical protein [Selenomonadaceae bacterium]
QTVDYTRTVTDAIDYEKAWRILTGKETIDTTTTVNKYSVKEITTETDPKKARKYNALVIHHGARANQAIDIHIKDMRSKALGIGDASVTTKDKAASSLDIIDAAIDYALDEATTLGAMMMRLEYTAANLTTAHENVQAGESVIRDADMAQAMTDYVKIGVLIQSGQSMLAQANQNASNVLGLLQ